MVVNVAVLCLLILPACVEGMDSATLGVNVTLSALTTEYKTQSTYLTTMPFTPSTTTHSITIKLTTVDKTSPTNNTTFAITAPPIAASRSSTTAPPMTTSTIIPATVTMFTDTTPATTTTMFTTTTPTTMFTATTSPAITTILAISTAPPTTTTMSTTTTSTFTPTTIHTTTKLLSSITVFTTNTPMIDVSLTTLLTSNSSILVPSTITTRTTQNSGSAQCHNGGYFDGIQCVCPRDFYGTFCELISNRITVGNTLTAKVNVDIAFSNVEFKEGMANAISEEFKHFEFIFKSEMNSVYYDVPGYKDVIIQEIRNGSIIVNHVVLVEIKYKLDLNILNQYNQMLERVRHLLEQLKTNKCTSAANPLCVDGKSITVTQIPPPSEEELCLDRVPKGNENFYDPVLFPDGLACVSHCDPYSPKHLSCNDGTCQVKSRSVPQCFCARTDLYIYTSLQCTGKISKLGLLIGSGFAIGILFIISIILGIYIYIVRKSMPKPFLTEDLYITTMI